MMNMCCSLHLDSRKPFSGIPSAVSPFSSSTVSVYYTVDSSERGKKTRTERLGCNPGGSDDKDDNGMSGYGVIRLSSVILHLQVGTLP